MAENKEFVTEGIHVIEYSAFDTLTAELASVRTEKDKIFESRQYWEAEAEKLRTGRDALQEKLRQVEETLDIVIGICAGFINSPKASNEAVEIAEQITDFLVLRAEQSGGKGT